MTIIAKKVCPNGAVEDVPLSDSPYDPEIIRSFGGNPEGKDDYVTIGLVYPWKSCAAQIPTPSL